VDDATRIDASQLNTHSAITVAGIADGVWDEACSGHLTSGTFGQALNIIRAGTAQAGGATTITLDASASATDDIYNYDLIVITAGTGAGQSRYITDYDGTTKVATVASWQTNPSSDSVFVILPGGQIPGATAPTAGEVADAVWDEATAGHTTSGTFGEQLKTDVDAILADTNELQTDWVNGGRLDLILDARASQTSVDTIDGIVDSILLDTGTDGVVVNAAGLATDAVQEIRNAITGGAYALDTDANGAIRIVDGTGARELNTSSGFIAGIAGTINTLDALDTAQDVEHDATQAAIAALNNLSAAQVNTEVLDVLNTDTFAEPGQGTPAATASLVAKIGYLYKAWRNKKTQDATTFKLFADDASTVDQKSTLSDDGTTFTFGEIATGS
jgi:hypothetical protein